MIPVILGIDETYILQAFVVIHSILKNSEEHFHFIILTKDEIYESVNKLKKTLADNYNNFVIDIRKVDNEAFSNVKIHNQHLSQSSYFRLLIPELVREYDKCLYLDSDILVNCNLRELYDIEVDEYYLAGVRDCHLSRRTNDFVTTKHQLKMGFPSIENYINAGVLVLNLKRLRNDGMTDKFLAQTIQENPYEDQDVINMCCYGGIKALPLKYNVFHHYSGNAIKFLFGGSYTKSEFTFNWNKPYIMHFAEKYKPWLNRKYKGADIWWKMAEIYQECECYQVVYRNCSKAESDIQNMKDIFEICNTGKKIYLWGFTDQGRDVCDVFLKRGIEVNAFCDSDIRKQGKSYRGISVLNANAVKKPDSDTLWIITCKNAYREVHRQITGMGVKPEDIFYFTFNNKSWKEYLVLSQEYYEEEIKVITLCENDNAQMQDGQYLEFLHHVIERADVKDEFYRYLYSKYRFDLWLKC